MERQWSIFYLITSISIIVYVVIRAISVGVTYDEAYTLNVFADRHTIEILNYTPCDANNHILNTLLIKLFFKSGYHSLFVARLPNVLYFFFYLYACYKITNGYLTKLIGFCTYLILVLNPFLIEFFSLARGYGLALALQAVSIMHLLSFLKHGRTMSVLYSLFLGAFAVFANFSVLHFWLSSVAVILTAISWNRKYYNRKVVIIILISFVFTFSVIYEPIRKMILNGKMYYGGREDIYHDTFISLAKYTYYSPFSNHEIEITLCIFIILFILAIISSLVHRVKVTIYKYGLLGLLLFCLASIISQHFLFGTFYVIDRTALFLYPIIILCLGFCLNESPKPYSLIVSYITVAVMALNFSKHANKFKTVLWYFDAHTSKILHAIDEVGKLQNKVMSISFSWPFESSIEYYLPHYKHVVNVNGKKDALGGPIACDYYIYLTQSLEQGGYTEGDGANLFIGMDTVKEYSSEYILIFSKHFYKAELRRYLE